MILSIVSGTYNRLSLLKTMIDSVRRQLPVGLTYEFVIVDGGSDDGTLDWCKQQADIALIEHGELRGAIPAFCDGAKAAHGKYVILANDDVHFLEGSILPGILYLEAHPNCGAIAYADNRPTPYKRAEYAPAVMPAMRNGSETYVLYAQVGMFRKWLGDVAGWWGADDPAFNARTYGGDNYLSSRIWEQGYTIDAVPECRVADSVVDDALRRINAGGDNLYQGEHPDSTAYYDRYPVGATIPDSPQIEQSDMQQLRVLYLPIYEPGHVIQTAQKHGLRDALARHYLVYEIDYMRYRKQELYAVIDSAIRRFQPHLVLTQLHGHDRVTVDWVRAWRAQSPRTVWVNWNGDYWPHGLITPPMIELLKYFDLQLVVNASVLESYSERGICAGYWQIGYEEPGDELPDMPAHDVVFLANAYSPERKQLGTLLTAYADNMGFNLGLYGDDWAGGHGSTLYDFATGKALYNRAKLAIGDNQFPNAYGYVSNRLFQALAAGGAMLLHQTVDGLEALTGLKDGVHYVAWTDTDELRDKLAYYLNPKHEKQRAKIARAGTAYTREHHSFEARVREFAEFLLPLAHKGKQPRIALHYKGRKAVGFKAYNHYEVQPDAVFYVDATDAPILLRNHPRVLSRAPVQIELQAVYS